MNKIEEIMDSLFNRKSKPDDKFPTTKYKGANDLTVDERLVLVATKESGGINIKTASNKLQLVKDELVRVGFLKFKDGDHILNKETEQGAGFVRMTNTFYFEEILKKGEGRYMEMNESMRLVGVSQEELKDLLWKNNAGGADENGKLFFSDDFIGAGKVHLRRGDESLDDLDMYKDK